MTRRPRSASFPLLAVALLAILLAGCGTSEKRTVAPEPENPFEAFRVGGDATLEIVTWNLHNFAEDAGAAEVALVAQAIEALGADVVALQEIAQAARFDALLDSLPA